MKTEDEAHLDAAQLFAGSGDVRGLARALNWSETSLGPTKQWSPALRTMVRLIFDSPFPICLWSGPDYGLIYNDPYRRILAAKHPAALGQPGSVVWAEIWDELQPQFDGVRAGGDPLYFEDAPFVMARLEGGGTETAWFDYSLSALRDEDGSVAAVLNITPETTGRLVIQRQLRELNADLERQVIERTHERGRTWSITPDMLSVLDVSTGVFDRVNPAWTTSLGWSASDLEGASFADFVHPDDLAASYEGLALLERGEPLLSFENRYRTKAGDYRWVRWVTVPANGKLYATSRDVTNEKAQVSELAQRTAERDEMWTLSRDVMLRCGFDGRIITVNPAWTEILGWREEELVGHALFDLIHPEDLRHTQEGAQAHAEGRSFERFDNRYRHKDGSYRCISWSTRTTDEVIVAVGRDVTDDRAKETELASAQEALRQSQKMEAVGQLTGGLAHDFNNLLAGISGSLEMMQTRIEQERFGDLERYMTGARGAAKRAAALTHRLLAFSRRQTLEPKPTDVDRLVAGMEDLVGRTVGPEIAVDFHDTPGLWPTLVDPNQLENALLNLCINARDAMPDGGRISIETGNRTIDERSANRRDMPRGDYVSLTVSDNGVGMSPEIMQRVFEPFFTTKPIGVGTGLGLSMIYGFANQSGGQVRIHSEVGKGTAVTIFLPRHAVAEATAIVAIPEVDDRKAMMGETVLVIDDEPLVRMLVVDVLEDLGYKAIEAGDGPEGLKVLRADTRIDLLITDVGLPKGMNGRQVADAARELLPGLKVLFVTGYAESAVLSHGHLDPGMQVVTKPFDLNVLAKRIQELIVS